MANSQYGMRRKTSRVEASVEISNTATLHCRGSRTQPGVRVQDDAAACPSNIEVAAMQNSEHIIIDLGRQLLGTREETAKTSWKDCRHPLSSLNQDEVVALQRSIHLKWIDNTNVDSPDRSHPKSRSSSTEFRKSQPLFSSTETMDVDSRHRYDVDCLSPLQLWMYQNSKDNMTFCGATREVEMGGS